MHKILTIARYTLREATRTQLPLQAAVAVGLLFAASLLVRELAIADSIRLQTTFLAAGGRLLATFITTAFIISTLQREFNERAPQLLLALDLPRGHYVLGKGLGGLGVATGIALLCALPALFTAAPGDWLAWAASLVLEQWIIAALALFCGISLRSAPAALLFTFGFYLLARSIAAIQLISHASLDAASVSHQYFSRALDGLALLLPRLDLFAPSVWLADGHTLGLGLLALQSAVYVALLLTATMFDLHRKNL